MDVLMPQLGETVTEGTVANWNKQVGDKVTNGDVLFEIETDKTSMEIPATCDGVLSEIRVHKGSVVAVGTIVAVIAESGAAPALSPVAAPAIAPSVAAAPAPVAAATAAVAPEARGAVSAGRRADGVTITPLARRLASQAGISLDNIRGSGPRGRILGRDIENLARSAVLGTTAGPGDANTAARAIAQFADVPFTEVPMDNMRKVIARRLLEAKQTIPHFYLNCTVDIDALAELRTAANEAAHRDVDGKPAYKVSVNDCVIKALAVALMRVPAANAVLADDRLLRFHRADIGVAVAIDGGLITPVLRHADSKSLVSVSNEIKQLAARARARKLLAAEYQGGSITVSNLGMYGVTSFSGIINPPQSAILAIGAAARVATEDANGGVRFVTRLNATLSCDHRIIDGAVGAELLNEFKRALEHPTSLLL